MIMTALLIGAALGVSAPTVQDSKLTSDTTKVTPRQPANDAELRDWLVNMITFHQFTEAEAMAATGVSPEQLKTVVSKYRIVRAVRNRSRHGDHALTVLPYPGGRHPRIGFLDGAMDPQRETKFSVFTPWDPKSYVVVDVPEAIFCQDGILYLAHIHVPTIWTKQNITLEPLEWKRKPRGVLEIERKLPNGAAYRARVVPRREWVEMELWLKNGTDKTLTGLRVQVCAMLKGVKGFDQQTNDNKVFRAPHAAAKSADGRRWIVMAWERCGRAWGNPPCPCLHSDPVFPDCPPGQTVRVKGRIWFHEGTEEEALAHYKP